MADEHEVLAVNALFYEAFADGDAEAMDALWSRREDVACTHPGWEALGGRHDVVRSWLDILESPPPIRFEDARAVVAGDMAFVVCVELLPSSRVAATNIFVREPDGWRMVHHHGSPIARRLARPPDEALN